ncbi:putative RmlC-like cupin domain-containing protein [Seiridium cardinale]|uniref:RmlC-like cupin domain-containing protein n=1 Tax=Seiridium cardinale TaxID=138064 RepID=A0ABR2XIR3_9PEZI
MQFTYTVAASILALSSSVLAAPYDMGNSTGTSGPTATTTGSTPTVTSNPLSGLSKTKQVFLSDSRADALNNVLTDDSDFVFNFEINRIHGPGKGGEIVPANRKTFPALTNTGIGAAVAFLEPCGFNTPHVHSRATELAIVVEGSVISSMFPENGVNLDGKPREISTRLEKFDSTVFYQGSVHSQYNPDCHPAVFVAAFNSEDAGTGQVAQELFGASDTEVTAAVFGNSFHGADVDKLKGQISTSVALGVESCLKSCKIEKRK